MAATNPMRRLCRSQIHRWHSQRGAVFIEHAGAVFVDHYGDSHKEISSAARLGICDLSLLPRDGITGPESTTWLHENHFEPPRQPNTSALQADGNLLVRLSAQEFLHLQIAHLKVDAVARDQIDWPGGSTGLAYPVPRADSHCLFAISGDSAALIFSTLCAVDLRTHRFAQGDVAQTSVARANAIVIRHDLGQTCNFFLLSATSVAEYLWECLLEAMLEFQGVPVGITALQATANNRT